MASTSEGQFYGEQRHPSCLLQVRTSRRARQQVLFQQGGTRLNWLQGNSCGVFAVRSIMTDHDLREIERALAARSCERLARRAFVFRLELCVRRRDKVPGQIHGRPSARRVASRAGHWSLARAAQSQVLYLKMKAFRILNLGFFWPFVGCWLCDHWLCKHSSSSSKTPKASARAMDRAGCMMLNQTSYSLACMRACSAKTRPEQTLASSTEKIKHI